MDINLTDKQRLQFRRNNYSFWEYQPLDGGTDETPKFFNRPNQTNSLNHVWTISPTMVNEVLATVSLDDVYIPVDHGELPAIAPPSGINYPYIFPQGKLIPTRIPTVNMTSFCTPERRTVSVALGRPDLHLSDSFTWIKGSHTLKFGVLLREVGRERQRRNQRQRLPHLHQQPERPVHLHRHPLRAAHHRRRDRQCRAGPVRHLLANSASAPTRSSAAACTKPSRRIPGR